MVLGDQSLEDASDALSDFVPDSRDLSRPSTRPQSPIPPRRAGVRGRKSGLSKALNEDEDGVEAATDPEDDESEEETAEESDEDFEEEPGEGKKAKKEKAKRKMEKVRKRSKEEIRKDQLKRFGYLLGETEVFKHFCDLKAQRDPAFAEMLQEAEKLALSKSGMSPTGKKNGRGGSGRRKSGKSEKDEDAELMAVEEKDAEEAGDEEEEQFRFYESPPYIKAGKMRDYQVQGLNWMIGLNHNAINGILADEMGLGKTLQTISFLGYLLFYKQIQGPHLVVVPKSTLDNWKREFATWVPDLKVEVLKGNKEERAELLQEKICTPAADFNVLITSYEICLREKNSLKRLTWEYIVIDEAHRIKNVDSMLSQIVRLFWSRNRLLVTGTPLQNNMKELWALLNFLLPDVFSSAEDFDAWFIQQKDKAQTDTPENDPVAMEGVEGPAGSAINQISNDEAAQSSVVKQLHAVLRPFLLRRVKADVEKSLLPKKEINVYVGMSEMQRKWYKMILEKDIDAVNGVTGKKEGKTRLLNVVMQLRKACNHPYLFDGAEPGPPYEVGEHLVTNSGKMIILDKLLKSMKEKGSRVLIFSQMSRVLDILEDYLFLRQYQYCRIDGSTAHEDRVKAIDDYNAPGSEKFIFLLTTRAGGLGINLTTADIVVLYDSDWNPQADLQAMDRAHRIGQTKQVYVFRFVTENAVEEKVLERAAQKLRLDQLVIQQGRVQNTSKGHSKDDLVDMIQHGAEKIISGDITMIDDDIDAIIKRGEAKTAEINSKWEGLDFDALNNFKSENLKEWEGENYDGKKKTKIWIEPSKRERKVNYSIDGYYRDHMKGGGQTEPGEVKKRGPRIPKALKQQATADFQFFPSRFLELHEKEMNWVLKSQNYIVPPKESTDGMTAAQAEAAQQAEQEKIDNAEPLTEAEEIEKDDLATLGFPTWNKRDFQAFIRGSEMYGKDAYELIATEFNTNPKTAEEIEDYAAVFWDRYQEIEGHEALISRIQAAEEKRAERVLHFSYLQEKISTCRHPLQQLQIPYAPQQKGKAYTEEEDRFILVNFCKYKDEKDLAYDLIRREISDWPAFRFDWFIKSRTSEEVKRRCTSLLQMIVKAKEEEEGMQDTERKKGRPSAAGLPVVAGKKRKNIDDEDKPTTSGHKRKRGGKR